MCMKKRTFLVIVKPRKFSHSEPVQCRPRGSRLSVWKPEMMMKGR